jgi:hypothetical protein
LEQGKSPRGPDDAKLLAQALTDDRATALLDQSIKELDRKLH